MTPLYSTAKSVPCHRPVAGNDQVHTNSKWEWHTVKDTEGSGGLVIVTLDAITLKLFSHYLISVNI